MRRKAVEMNLHEKAVLLSKTDKVLLQLHTDYDKVFDALVACKCRETAKILRRQERKLND